MSRLNIQGEPDTNGAQYRGNLPAMSTFALTVNTESLPTSPQGTSPPTTSSPLDSTMDDTPSPPASPVVIDVSTAPVIHAPEFSVQEFVAIAETAHRLATHGALQLPSGERGLMLYAPPQFARLLASPSLPREHVAENASKYLQNLVHPTLSHHQMLLGMHHRGFENLHQVMQALWDQFSMAHEWSNHMFELVSANQRDSIAMQQYFLDQIEHLRVSVPDFVRDSFQNYDAQQAPWRGRVEQTITELTQVLRVTIEDLNRLTQHINTAFANVDSGFNTLAETVYSTIPEAIAQASAKQQAEVNRLTRDLADLQTKVESFHAFPPEKETKIWNAIREARSGTRANPRQPTPEVIPDPRIPVLTTQVRGVEARLEEIQAELATLSANLGDHEDGCCPGINNNPRIHCAERLHELSLLVQQLQGVDATHGADIAELDARSSSS